MTFIFSVKVCFPVVSLNVFVVELDVLHGKAIHVRELFEIRLFLMCRGNVVSVPSTVISSPGFASPAINNHLMSDIFTLLYPLFKPRYFN